jgi:hypothetical protein
MGNLGARMNDGPPRKSIAIWLTSTTATTTEEAEELEHSIRNIKAVTQGETVMRFFEENLEQPAPAIVTAGIQARN